MARTRESIYEELIAEKQRVADLSLLYDDKEIKEALSEISEVQSGSRVSLWRLWLYIVSYAIWLHEQVFDLHKEEVNSLISSALVHTDDWYAEKMLLYQHGDVLKLHPDTKQPYYEVVDEDKQVVKYVAVTGKGFALVKLRGESGPLSTDERDGAEAYLREIQEPGAQLGVISLPSDKLRLYADLFYEPEMDRATVESAVQATVADFVDSLPFNGTMLRNDLIAEVRKVPGVRDFYVTVLQGRADAGVYEEITDRYYAASGWMELDDYLINSIADV